MSTPANAMTAGTGAAGITPIETGDTAVAFSVSTPVNAVRRFSSGFSHMQSSPMSQSPYQCSPMSMFTSSPFSPKTPLVVSPFFPSQSPGSPERRPKPHSRAPWSPTTQRSPRAQWSPTAQWSPNMFSRQRSPSSTFPQVCMSPGERIRHNAAVFGIPLNLQSSAEVSVPVPVRTKRGAAVAPSPTATGDAFAPGALFKSFPQSMASFASSTQNGHATPTRRPNVSVEKRTATSVPPPQPVGEEESATAELRFCSGGSFDLPATLRSVPRPLAASRRAGGA